MERAQLIALLRATGCTDERGRFIFLRDPKSPRDDRAQYPAPNTAEEVGWLCIPTGGTSGGVRHARHDEQTLAAAGRGFCAHFGLERVNAVDVLPAFHVSGLMARVRCAATGGEHVALDWKQLQGGTRPALDRSRGDWVISLVPTQLQRLMASSQAMAWLRGFRIIFVGGGPVWSELAEAAARAELPLALSYGMTETAAMVAALRPEEFLAGARSNGLALPHAKIATNGDGVIRVAGESVFRGYFPELRAAREFETEDLGRLDDRGHLHVFGRRDSVIITGGKKVHPAEVEAIVRATGEFADIAILGVPDAEWGQAVVAFYPASGRVPDFERAVENLAGHQRPKRFIRVVDWPRNEQGKIDRALLLAAAKNPTQ